MFEISVLTFNDLKEFKEMGFEGFKSISELFQSSSTLPDEQGVYCILTPINGICNFLEVGCGGHFKGKNPNVSLQELKRNWVLGSQVIYIGKAGGEGRKSTLRTRLRQYLKFGHGKPVGHWGGRLIWQIQNSSDLIVCWKSLPSQEPREYEAELIRHFVSRFGQRPFANFTD
ncbi:hypothetical protein [Mucilaginibacter kameinonensis]|uniref:hypothetical protein n=1 Tax=Mucilaginibacter kameinonensis TaxID=452286 RepID=UPI001ABF0B98|nr:hypothetical protein [Mucilaginibacter kameinonensis]